ncbi:ATP-dependent DNA helicase [Dentipellis sp. KUC8613]|nr:ATP-dependent DNA helicase [Dentipellis sp. KUC8613]
MPTCDPEEFLASDDPELYNLIRLTAFEYDDEIASRVTRSPEITEPTRSSSTLCSSPVARQHCCSDAPVASSSKTTLPSSSRAVSPFISRTRPSGASTRVSALQAQLSQAADDIRQLDDAINDLEAQRSARAADERRLWAELQEAEEAARTTDYFGRFEWSVELSVKMERYFGFKEFRIVCNANMDKRDIMCIMPTGGGKSLTYQLPALLSTGCTFVISPLLALMRDQIHHLRDAGIEAVMVSSITPSEECMDTMRRLREEASGIRTDNPIKLCYLSPEKITQSDAFRSILADLYRANRLARFVVDEAHCVADLGRNFRPDYNSLSDLRKLFPDVPILALSATCSPAVLKDVCDTLGLPPLTQACSAEREDTVFFTAPLYRKNLHYRVVPKPSVAKEQLEMMVRYILAEHAGHSGIIYCLSRKDTENIAKQLHELSGGKIRTGVYHGEIRGPEKEKLYEDWRTGTVKVVCATIAFGLGIDKADVRFVIHHSKSVDNYYQESGRAGRDGKDADCVLYYRSQDAFRFTDMAKQRAWKSLLEMMRFGQNLRECRKVYFARYFSEPAHPTTAAWTDNLDGGALTPCGHCDNCTREDDALETRDVTLEAWRILRALRELQRRKRRCTVAQLCECVRGVGDSGCKVELDVLGGKVELSASDTEHLIIDMLLARLVVEDCQNTFKDKNTMYMQLGTPPEVAPITEMSQAQIEAGEGQRIECTFLRSVKSKGKGKGKCTEVAPPEPVLKRKRGRPPKNTAWKGKEKATASTSASMLGADEDEDAVMGAATTVDDESELEYANDTDYEADEDRVRTRVHNRVRPISSLSRKPARTPMTISMRESRERAISQAKFEAAANAFRLRRSMVESEDESEARGWTPTPRKRRRIATCLWNDEEEESQDDNGRAGTSGMRRSPSPVEFGGGSEPDGDDAIDVDSETY